MAKVAEGYYGGLARKTETVLGWNRESVQLALHERRSGIMTSYRFTSVNQLKPVI